MEHPSDKLGVLRRTSPCPSTQTWQSLRTLRGGRTVGALFRCCGRFVGCIIDIENFESTNVTHKFFQCRVGRLDGHR
jgi:hypothetical protein